MDAEHERTTNRFHIVAGQTSIVGDAAIKINCAKELFKRRRLQNYLSFAVRDNAGPIEDDAVVSAHQIDEDYGKLRQSSPGEKPLRNAGPSFPC